MKHKSSNESNHFLYELHCHFVVNKVYRNSELDLASLSDVLGMPKRKTSRFIQSHFDKSFSNFLNDHRLEDVLQRFKNKDYERHTIMAIGLASGFPSKSTFYRYFKKKLKISPADFLRNTMN